MDITLTREEQKAIKKLESLAKRWPGSLKLFSWSGDLVVIKNRSIIGSIDGFWKAGEVPDNISYDAEYGLDQVPNIIYE